MSTTISLYGKWGSSIGNYAIIDDEDYFKVSSYKWYINKGYIYAKVANKHVALHRFVTNTIDETIHIDHINHNKLDNTKNNLRRCTRQQNNRNTKKVISQRTTTIYKGVKSPKNNNRFYAQISHQGKLQFIGAYDTVEKAAIAYDKKAIELFGEFANLNFPNNDYNIIDYPVSIKQTPSRTGEKYIYHNSNYYKVLVRDGKRKIQKHAKTLEEAKSIKNQILRKLNRVT